VLASWRKRRVCVKFRLGGTRSRRDVTFSPPGPTYYTECILAVCDTSRIIPLGRQKKETHTHATCRFSAASGATFAAALEHERKRSDRRTQIRGRYTYIWHMRARSCAFTLLALYRMTKMSAILVCSCQCQSLHILCRCRIYDFLDSSNDSSGYPLDYWLFYISRFKFLEAANACSF
jgi:hypothetical protein